MIIALVLNHNEPSIIFIKRPEYDGVHSGQMALPGGKKEKEDSKQQLYFSITNFFSTCYFVKNIFDICRHINKKLYFNFMIKKTWLLCLNYYKIYAIKLYQKLLCLIINLLGQETSGVKDRKIKK